METWIIVLLFIIAFVIGCFIGNLLKTSSSRSSLSDSLAKMIYSTVDNTKEYFNSSTPDKDIEAISILVSEGKLKEIEDMINKEDNNIEDITKKIDSSSEVLKPELIKDEEIKDAVSIINLEGKIQKIKDKIYIAELTLNTIINNVSSTDEEKQKAQTILNELVGKLAELQIQMLPKMPLGTALFKVKDPEKLAHLQEIQARILKKREEIKKKYEEKVKQDNPKFKDELERKIKEEKYKFIEEKKNKIVRENIEKDKVSM